MRARMLETVKRRNNLNLIRLLAAGQVMLVHGLNHLGFDGPLVMALKLVPGVPTFFFLSGLLIYGSYDRTNANGISAFFRNRALRIFPGLWVCVALATACVIASGYLSRNDEPTSWTSVALWAAGQASIFQFYNPEFMRGFGLGVLNGALWTITVELQFYIITPIRYILLHRYKYLFLLLFVCSMIFNVYTRYSVNAEMIAMKLAYVSFFPWVFMYMSGFWLASQKLLIARLQKTVIIRWALPLYIVSMIFIDDYTLNASNAINPVSFVLLSLCLVRISTMELVLPEKFLNFIVRDDFSYGVYLYHMPVLNFLIYYHWLSPEFSLIVLAGGSFLLAAMSWYLVERAALRYKR